MHASLVSCLECVAGDLPNRGSAAGNNTFAFPYPSSSAALFCASSSAPTRPDVEIAAYEALGDSALLTPTTSASPSAYLPTHQAPSSRLHEDLETLSQLDPLLHPALKQPSVEEPPSPPGTSLVISSPRAAGYSNVLSIRPSGDAATTGASIFQYTVNTLSIHSATRC